MIGFGDQAKREICRISNFGFHFTMFRQKHLILLTILSRGRKIESDEPRLIYHRYTCLFNQCAYNFDLI